VHWCAVLGVPSLVEGGIGHLKEIIARGGSTVLENRCHCQAIDPTIENDYVYSKH
jgi:hypothetical protein